MPISTKGSKSEVVDVVDEMRLIKGVRRIRLVRDCSKTSNGPV